MALSKDRLGNAMADAVLTISGLTPIAADETKLRDLMKVLADEIIKEFIANAVVSTNLAVTSVSGVTTGFGSSGPGTGTGTGGISA